MDICPQCRELVVAEDGLCECGYHLESEDSDLGSAVAGMMETPAPVHGKVAGIYYLIFGLVFLVGALRFSGSFRVSVRAVMLFQAGMLWTVGIAMYTRSRPPRLLVCAACGLASLPFLLGLAITPGFDVTALLFLLALAVPLAAALWLSS